MTTSKLNLYMADTFLTRLRGLLFRRMIAENEALLIRPCDSVHTFGMKYEIVVVFLDCKGEQLERHKLGPNKFRYCKQAKMVLECRCDDDDVVDKFIGIIEQAVSINSFK